MNVRSLTVSLAAAVAATTAMGAIVSGNATEVGPNITHPNGNVYDQVLMTGDHATIGSDAGQVVRISFLDINDDIVQVEFSGAGRLTLRITGGAAPAAAATKYNQPGVLYVRGLASLTFTGSDSTTNVSVFTVGSVTANGGTASPVLRNDVTYDGIADLALLTILPDPSLPNGTTFGGIRMANVAFSARSGDTGIYAPSVHVQDVVRISDIAAFDSAIPKLWFGSASQFGAVSVEGGDLAQPNGRAIQAHYTQNLSMTAGQTSSGVGLPAQPFRGTFSYPVTGP